MPLKLDGGCNDVILIYYSILQKPIVANDDVIQHSAPSLGEMANTNEKREEWVSKSASQQAKIWDKPSPPPAPGEEMEREERWMEYRKVYCMKDGCNSKDKILSMAQNFEKTFCSHFYEKQSTNWPHTTLHFGKKWGAAYSSKMGRIKFFALLKYKIILN